MSWLSIRGIFFCCYVEKMSLLSLVSKSCEESKICGESDGLAASIGDCFSETSRSGRVFIHETGIAPQRFVVISAVSAANVDLLVQTAKTSNQNV
jgi:hypothetical protein